MIIGAAHARASSAFTAFDGLNRTKGMLFRLTMRSVPLAFHRNFMYYADWLYLQNAFKSGGLWL
jgi:uncharacterized membrane protein (UPF0127 family)